MGAAVLAPALESLRNVETFAEGVFPGDQPGETWKYSDADLKAIKDNFDKLSAGESPTHSVPVVVTHDGKQQYGVVVRVKVEGDKLFTDWTDVDPKLKAAILAKKFRKVSGEIKKDFLDRSGETIPGPYLYRVSVIGADVPRVKGLADIPVEQWFSDPRPTMDRAAAVAFLESKGVTVPEGVPDDFIIAVATAMQAQEAAVVTNADVNGVQMTREEMEAKWVELGGDPAELAGKTDDEVAAMLTAKMGAQMSDTNQTQVQTPARQPSQITMKFADQIKKAADAEIRRIQEAAAASQKKLTDATAKREAEERVQATRLFCDRMTKEGKLSPAENDEATPTSPRSRLVRLAMQPQTVHKFSEGGKQVAKSELDLQMAEVESREPRRFSEKVAAKAPAADRNPALKRASERYFAGRPSYTKN